MSNTVVLWLQLKKFIDSCHFAILTSLHASRCDFWRQRIMNVLMEGTGGGSYNVITHTAPHYTRLSFSVTLSAINVRGN